MTAEGHKIVSLHGQQTVEERDDVMTRFRKGEFKVSLSPFKSKPYGAHILPWYLGVDRDERYCSWYRRDVREYGREL